MHEGVAVLRSCNHLNCSICTCNCCIICCTRSVNKAYSSSNRRYSVIVAIVVSSIYLGCYIKFKFNVNCTIIWSICIRIVIKALDVDHAVCASCVIFRCSRSLLSNLFIFTSFWVHNIETFKYVSRFINWQC